MKPITWNIILIDTLIVAKLVKKVSGFRKIKD